jgi:hypothetical protein
MITKTKVGTFTLAALLIITGVILDSSGNAISQTLHHVFFILGGVAIGDAIWRR